MNEEIQEEVESQVEEQEVEEVEEPSETGEEEISEPPSQEEEEEEGNVPVKAVIDERRKRQEFAKENEDLKKQLEEIQKGLQDLKPKGQPKDIYEAYDNDPQGVTGELNAEIQRLLKEDQYANIAQVEQLRDLKDELRRREVSNIQKQLQQQTLASKVVQAVTTAIPDFHKKHESLTRFAVEELDYSMDELRNATNPSRGQEAVKEILRINKLYDKFNAKPQKKVVKSKPTEVEDTGKGIKQQAPNMSKLIEEAQNTGNWEAVFEARGLLPD